MLSEMRPNPSPRAKRPSQPSDRCARQTPGNPVPSSRRATETGLPERYPEPSDPDFGCGPRYHRLDTTGFSGGLELLQSDFLDPPAHPDRLVLDAAAAANGMGC